MGNWREHELHFYLTVPQLVTDDVEKTPIPDTFQQHVIATFKLLPDRQDLVSHCSAFLGIINYLTLSPATLKNLMDLLSGIIQQNLNSPKFEDPRTLLSFGIGLKVYAEYEQSMAIKSDIWPQVYGLADKYGNLPSYLQAVIHSLKSNERLVISAYMTSLPELLIDNLHSPSHILRKLSLEILSILHARSDPRQMDIVSTMLAIEESPINLQSARSLSMHVRKLSAQSKAVEAGGRWQQAIAHFCFGLQTFKLSQLWDDAVDVLKALCGARAGEEVVAGLAFHYLEASPPIEAQDHMLASQRSIKQTVNKFECTNMSAIESRMDKNSSTAKDVLRRIDSGYIASHQLALRVPREAPKIALRVLLGVPHVAERHSRQLVPIFLHSMSEEKDDAQIFDENIEDIHSETGEALNPQTLARKERKLLLDVFGCFVNPKVLYQSNDVFEALKGLLSSGDVNEQKSALKALMTWKLPGLEPYQDNLNNLLDDARFREEIAVFVNVDDVDSTIRSEHRQDVMPILLRLLFGKTIARSGSSGRASQLVRRKAVLGALSHFGVADLREFVEIALGPLAGKRLVQDETLDESLLCQEILGVRKQVGLVNMLKDMLETLGSQLTPLTAEVIEALLYCTVRAARLLSSALNEHSFDDTENGQASLLKDVRQVGLQCFTLVFQHTAAEAIRPYLPVFIGDLVNPRLEKLPIETAQSVSGLLRLFATWASRREMVTIFHDYNDALLRSVVDCLDVASAKPAIKLFVLDNILKGILRSADGPADDDNKNVLSGVELVQKVVSPHISYILKHLGKLIGGSPSRDLLESSIELVAMLAPLVEGSTETQGILEISAFLLEQPSHRVKPKSKGELLRIAQHFIPLSYFQLVDGLQDRLFGSVSSLFGYFKDRTNRQILCKVLHTLGDRDSELVGIPTLCTDLNSFSDQRLGEPDFERRLAAFNTINETQFQDFTPKQWRPLIYNMLFYIRDEDEIAIRSSAAFALRRFAESHTFATTKGAGAAFAILESILLPALREGASQPSELVRSEYLNVMAHVIRHNPDWEKTSDMYGILANDDEEASLFTNILHIQHHRRLRALRRLAGEANKGGLRSYNVAHFLLPLIEHFVFDRADDESAHNLSAETITTISALAQWLEWPQYRALLRRYTGYIQSKPALDKSIIKLVGRTIDAASDATSTREAKATSTPQSTVNRTEANDGTLSRLALTMPKPEKLAEDITKNLLPSLRQYLHEKDESTVSLRIPVAVSTVKLLKLLPPDELKDNLPSILTDVCNILRSRTQESRDLTRKTLVDISALIGPSCFGFVLRELRSSLARGYQLHVLSYTVHAILVATADTFAPGELDYCVPQIVSVIMDDVFGATGQEKDAEEYISKMKEVKSSKSFDSMELISKTSGIESFIGLLRPLQSLLQERLDSKMVRKIDELLRRIGAGMQRNQSINDHRVLEFCHELIREVYKTGIASQPTRSKEDPRTKRFLISMKTAAKNGAKGSTSSHSYKLARFALDVLRSVLHKYDDLRTPANLHGFIPIIGDCIIKPNEEVQIAALRLLTTIIKVPLTEIDENAGIYVTEAVKIIKAATSTNTEIAQAALKLVSAVLRERRHVEISNPDLAYLLKRLVPDLEEPDRQGVIFGFLKAVLARRIVNAELYEAMDTVATIMVTNHTKGSRDLARSVYFQVIIDYDQKMYIKERKDPKAPQRKGRFAKQLAFLVHNLDYKHQEGRQSVMETMHLLLSKVDQGLVEEVADTFFAPLLMVIVNDESVGCREMASALVKTIFERAEPEQNERFLALLRSWSSQLDQPLLTRAALQVYGIYLESAGSERDKKVPALLDCLGHVFKVMLRHSNTVEWEMLYAGLQALSKVCQTSKSQAFTTSYAPLWASVRECLSFPHAWVKLATAKLLGLYFADFARSNPDIKQNSLPLKGSHGLLLNGEEMTSMTKASLRILRVPGVGEDLAAQTVRNLVFLGKAMGDLAFDSGNTDEQAPAEVDEEEVDADESDNEPNGQQSQTASRFIFQRISVIVRRGPATKAVAALTPMKAALQLVGALCNHLSIDALMPSIETILLPLHNLTDPSIPAPFSADENFTTNYKSLVSNSAEIMALLQKKLGTTEYVARLNKVRSLVKERREGRRVKRRIEAVAEPEKAGKLKQRKGEKKRDKRKERSGQERGKRRGW